MNAVRPETTLFLIQSLDGKITTGDVDARDVDADFPRIPGVAAGLHQYYDLEKQTDNVSLNSGRVMAKIGVNRRRKDPMKLGCSFIIIDNKPHLTAKGVMYLSKWVQTLYLVTTNSNHPAFKLAGTRDNIVVLRYRKRIDFEGLLTTMRKRYGVRRLTIQSGGTLNARWLRLGLVDHVSVVIAPCLIGGANTQSLVGGASLRTIADLKKISVLRLVRCNVLDHSYLHILYDVIRP